MISLAQLFFFFFYKFSNVELKPSFLNTFSYTCLGNWQQKPFSLQNMFRIVAICPQIGFLIVRFT